MGEKADPGTVDERWTQIHCHYCGQTQNVPQRSQEAMKKAVHDENDGGMLQSEAENRMERTIRFEDCFHMECF
jgi:hypothetical protein